MAREQANIGTSLWGDRDWRELPQSAKYLYLLLLSHPSITYAGVVDWRPARLSMFSPDTTRESISRDAEVLQKARFIFVDEESEEVVIRSYLRHDGILKQPKLSVSMANAYATISSKKIQDIIAYELHRLVVEHPEWAAWKSPKVVSILKNEGQDINAFTLSGAQALPLPTGSPATQSGDQAVALPTSTTTATTTNTSFVGFDSESPAEEEKKTRKKPSIAIPANWSPTAEHERRAREKNLNVTEVAEAFKLHAEAHDRRAANWNAAFTMWLTKAQPKQATAWG
ncbi:hypothetical protein [Glutamicibacter sp.]|uniref:hypothetical protein n=2 Tax=Glutamicibacter sp. TaxID=1931995 RepID=UPI002FDB9244